MTKLFSQNKKMSKSTNDNYLVFNFGIPAFKSANGEKTCPMAGQCGKDAGCYALQGPYRWANVAQAYEFRYQKTKLDNFPELAQIELDTLKKRAKKQGKQLVIRIHDSGDYYSLSYTKKWFNIMLNNEEVLFYSYTKMIPLFKKLKTIPDNFTVIYSEGGVADHLIDINNDRHSRVFTTSEELENANYDNAMDNDLVACLSDNNRIGLIYHGAKSKTWATNRESEVENDNAA